MRSPAGLAWGTALAIATGSILSALIFTKRRNPREKERRRRDLVNTQGRVIEGYVTRCEDGFIEYSYHWQGVRYEAAQDISDFLTTTSGLIGFTGPVTVRFLSSRPGNSIVLSERWSGIREIRRQTAENFARQS
jgi:hypothetical protein